ncbi:hypothetical protein [Rhodococcus sp. RD6.2]|nr:hypothetical protein [Rhodococcus sp. RD6.2]
MTSGSEGAAETICDSAAAGCCNVAGAALAAAVRIMRAVFVDSPFTLLG